MKELLDFSKQSDLINRINDADLEIGMVELGKRPNWFPAPSGYTELGRFECDPIAINESTNEVVMLDHEVDGRVMSHVAKDIFAFVRALARLEEHYQECEENEDLYEDEAFMLSSARAAGELAGGEKYSDFYKNFFGV